MKRDRSKLPVALTAGAAVTRRARPPKRMRRLDPIGSICPGDQTGPRIHSLLQEFSRGCTIGIHMKWLLQLEECCAREGCYVTHCASRGAFSLSHGAKTLVNYITMFLTYHVPRSFALTSDDEWRELLVALRTFHVFCVRQRYISEDSVLMAALYKLRRFNICEIPQRITKLGRERFWDSLEMTTTTVLSLVDDDDEDDISNEYERYLGDEMPIVVEQVKPDGWQLRSEEFNDDDNPIQDSSVFLRLPPDAAKLGMKGMSLSGLLLGLRGSVWRPVEHDGIFVMNTYPPDELFYY